VKGVGVELSDEEVVYLEEAYIPHELVGVMAQNKGKTTFVVPQNKGVKQ
jgi:hypothetical protein